MIIKMEEKIYLTARDKHCLAIIRKKKIITEKDLTVVYKTLNVRKDTIYRFRELGFIKVHYNGFEITEKGKNFEV